MLRKRLAATLTPLLIVVTGAAFASPPASARGAEPSAKLTEVLTVLHAVSQWSTRLSAMADQRAGSALVKEYADGVAASNSEKDARLTSIANEHGIDLAPLDPRTEEGKSLLDRMQAETVLLSSLQGDAFDKEYMTLVTNTQQSLIHFLQARKAAATDPDVRQFMDNLIASVQKRLKTAQSIMLKVYGDNI